MLLCFREQVCGELGVLYLHLSSFVFISYIIKSQIITVTTESRSVFSAAAETQESCVQIPLGAWMNGWMNECMCFLRHYFPLRRADAKSQEVLQIF
jgi:hypothetical protein